MGMGMCVLKIANPQSNGAVLQMWKSMHNNIHDSAEDGEDDEG